MYNPAFHKRRSIRLKNYDYSSEGLYFITLCTIDRKNIFGEIINGKMHLNLLGKIAEEEWKNTPKIRKNISLAEFIIMPNHIHGIISIDYKIKKSDTGIFQYPSNTPKKDSNTRNNPQSTPIKPTGFHSPSQTIGAIIRGYKGATTKRINNLIREIKENSISTGELQFTPTLQGKGSIWQRNYYEHIIKSEQAFYNISNYIINNPANWKKDKLK